MCLLMDPGLVYGFTKPFDDYFRDHTDLSARAAVTKFLTQRCEVPRPVAMRLMASPNFYHPAIFQLVGARKGGALADYESLLGAKRYLSTVEVFMKLNTINSQDSSECLRAIAELSQVTEEFEYVYETLTQRVLAIPESDALVGQALNPSECFRALPDPNSLNRSPSPNPDPGGLVRLLLVQGVHAAHGGGLQEHQVPRGHGAAGVHRG
jgi:hypothetical protein